MRKIYLLRTCDRQENNRKGPECKAKQTAFRGLCKNLRMGGVFQLDRRDETTGFSIAQIDEPDLGVRKDKPYLIVDPVHIHNVPDYKSAFVAECFKQYGQAEQVPGESVAVERLTLVLMYENRPRIGQFRSAVE